MRFIVAQTGARRGYAVPAILERAGMLERFYTDMTANAGLGALLAAFPFVNGRAERLAGRRLPENLRGRTTSFSLPNIAHALRRATKSRDPSESFRDALRCSVALGEAMARRGFGKATHLYSMLGECGPLLATARARNVQVVLEIYILLSAEKILTSERKKFPGWEQMTPDFAAIRREFGYDDLPLSAGDFAVCPSEAVRDDLVLNFGVGRQRCAVVPYGMNPKWLSLETQPQRGRVLFAGTADLRKGIHYLAMAAERLMAKGRQYDFRIAGNVSPTVARQSTCRHLNFLGRVPRDRVADEFATADVFVLPSLAEGSAEVTYEALAAGVPVVTTKAAGSVARDGIEGRIISERDPEALAAAIEEIVEDRAKRDQMAAAARERAKDFTWEKYGEQLITALKSFPQ